LAAAKRCSSLRVLLLRWNNLGNADAQALAASRYLTSLNVLDLQQNQIGDAGAQHLAQAPCLAGVTLLNLERNRIGDPGAEALASSPYLTNLYQLLLVGNRIRPLFGAIRLGLPKALQSPGACFRGESWPCLGPWRVSAKACLPERVPPSPPLLLPSRFAFPAPFPVR
jgi:hypothetical protein